MCGAISGWNPTLHKRVGMLFTCSAFLLCSVGFQPEMAPLIYGENLWGKFTGKICGENLRGKFTGKIYGENLWGKI